MSKFVSLFAGVGGFELGLERAGHTCVATCEIDKHAQKILTRHFPKAKLFSDVTTLTGQELFDAGFNSDGIIVGGFPCQDVSVAGKRAGLSDTNGNATRSGLFWQVVRLLEETKAQHFILENVPGLLSSNEGRDFAVVLNALVKLGYGVSWRILDARYFGVPQRRRRVFIVGHLGNDGRTSAEILAIAEGRAGYLAKGKQKGKTTASATRERAQVFSQSGFAKYTEGVMPLTATSYKRPEDTIVVPFTPSSFAQYKEEITSITATLRAGGGDLGGGSETLLVLSKMDEVIFEKFKGTGNMEQDFMKMLCQRFKDLWGTGGGNVPMVNEGSIVRRLTPMECERLQGFPDGWTDKQADSNRYKQMGNAVAVPVVEWIGRRL